MNKFIEKIKHFFWWASGAEINILKNMPTEHSKYTGIGGTIVFTALMATFAGGYAFFTAFKTVYLSIFFGIFWGSLIFNLDRYIVSSFGVGDGKRSISRQELFEASPRLIMAIILGFVIATPLELKLFEKEINVEIESLKIENKEKIIHSDTTFYNDLNEKKRRVREIEIRLDELRRNIKKYSTDPTGYLDDAINSNKEDIKNLKEDLQLIKRKESVARGRYYKAKKDTTGKYSNNEINKLFATYNGYKKKKKNIINNIDKSKTDLMNLIDEKHKKIGKNVDAINKEIAQLNSEKEELNKDIVSINEMAKEKEKYTSSITNQYDGLMARLEALDRLTQKHTSLHITKWLITLLFIMIEIAPILFKMMMESGPYDQEVERIRYEKKILNMQSNSNLNENINFDLKIHTEKNKQRLENELKANEDLIKSIANAQVEIAKAAIEEWKKEKIKEAKGNVNKIIKSK